MQPERKNKIYFDFGNDIVVDPESFLLPISLNKTTFSFLCCNPSFCFTFNNLYAWLGLLYYLCPLRIEEETGSAEEQPASNKSLRYTVTI